MSSLGRGKTPLSRALIWFWDMVDISENIKRAEKTAYGHSNGPSAWLHAAVFIILGVVGAALAWKFDVESTLIGMSTLRDTVLEGLPSSVLKFSYFIALCLTLAPTFVEMFTAAHAKADVKIMQVCIIVFTVFDLITDIPRAMTFTNQLQENFNQMGAMSGIAYWIFFTGWLFLSTLGFELFTVICGWLAFVYIMKAISDEPVRSMPVKSGGGKPSTIELGEKDRINVVG